MLKKVIYAKQYFTFTFCNISGPHFLSHCDFSNRQNLFQSVHKQEQTDEIKQSIGKLSSLVGALQIHEVMIDSNLVIKKKNLPTDPFYKAVLINQTRRPVTNDLEFDDV